MKKQRLNIFRLNARLGTIMPALTDAEYKRVNKFVWIFYFLFVTNLFVVAQNPISPPGVYIADPSAHVWADGRLYIYGSNDESTKYYCSWTHHVLSTSDLMSWDLTRDVFSSKGRSDGVPYNDDLLYAPDCQYKNGKYYLYYCQPSTSAEGVATSKSPLGPFVNAKRMETKGINEIDPCVFIDDDGQAYYIWGQFTAKMAKLKPSMTEIDSTTIKDNIVTEKEHFFHEGGYMVKRNGIYYFVYAHIGRLKTPSCIGYATSKSPMGPFKYGGVIIDNNNCDPSNWNNHGSIVEFKGQWYVFYHRATHNSKTMRKACVEPIYFNKDGSIIEAEMTSQGAAKPLKAKSKIEAERACLVFGGTYIDSFSPNEEKLSNMRNECKAVYKYIEFNTDITKIEIRVKPGKGTGTIQLGLDQSLDKPFSTISVPPNSGNEEWAILQATIKKTQGVHALWIKFTAEEGVSIDIDWFRFL
ncbi:MAG TPA: family 43 glycosylhydrolase [Bacteroidales bacterium]